MGLRGHHRSRVTPRGAGLPRHLDNFLTIFTRYPEMTVVIDRGMKPQIATPTPERFTHWADGMSRLAARHRPVAKYPA